MTSIASHSSIHFPQLLPSFQLPPLLISLLILLLLLPTPSLAQQIGSFFTAIYLNGAPIASYQSSCANMGQAQYCCGAGQSCAWDDTGHVACCASGTNCQGSPYGSGAGGGGGVAAGAYSPATSSYYQVAPITTTVFTQGQTTTGCNCNQAPTLTTSYYVVPTSTYYASPASASTTTTTIINPSQSQGQGQSQVTTVVPAGGGGGQQVSTRGLVACATVSTLTEANVGQAVRTVGCLIIFNEGSRQRHLEGETLGLMAVVFLGLVGVLVY